MLKFDLQEHGLRKLNNTLHDQKDNTNQKVWEIVNPKGRHAIAVGIDAPIEVNIKGSTGYYCGGMNKQAIINVKGSVGPGVAENMMSGKVVVEATYADTNLLEDWVNFKPSTSIEEGIKKYVQWYLNFYKFKNS